MEGDCYPHLKRVGCFKLTVAPRYVGMRLLLLIDCTLVALRRQVAFDTVEAGPHGLGQRWLGIPRPYVCTSSMSWTSERHPGFVDLTVLQLCRNLSNGFWH